MSDKITEDEPKFKQVKVNLYVYQHQQIKEKAKSNNTTIAQYIREQLDLNLDPKYTRKIYTETQKKVYKETDPKLLYEVNKIGSNLNQIAKYINTQKDNINIVEILKTLVEIESDMKRLI